MLKLFKFENYTLVVEPEAALLKPIKDVIEECKKNKTDVLQVLGFIYFMCDPRSDYMEHADWNVRMKAVIEGEGMDEKWKPTNKVKIAMQFYESFKPASALMLEATKKQAKRLEEDMDALDGDECESVMDRATLAEKRAKLLSITPKIILSLAEAERNMFSEIKQSAAIRGGMKNKAIFEDSDYDDESGEEVYDD